MLKRQRRIMRTVLQDNIVVDKLGVGNHVIRNRYLNVPFNGHFKEELSKLGVLVRDSTYNFVFFLYKLAYVTL